MALTRDEYWESLVRHDLEDGMTRELAEACADATVCHVEDLGWGFPINWKP